MAHTEPPGWRRLHVGPTSPEPLHRSNGQMMRFQTNPHHSPRASPLALAGAGCDPRSPPVTPPAFLHPVVDERITSVVNIPTRGDFAQYTIGLGIRGKTVEYVTTFGPACNSGQIEQGDEILSVDGIDLGTRPSWTVVNSLQGSGALVRVKVRRSVSTDRVFEVDLIRCSRQHAKLYEDVNAKLQFLSSIPVIGAALSYDLTQLITRIKKAEYADELQMRRRLEQLERHVTSLRQNYLQRKADDQARVQDTLTTHLRLAETLEELKACQERLTTTELEMSRLQTKIDDFHLDRSTQATSFAHADRGMAAMPQTELDESRKVVSGRGEDAKLKSESAHANRQSAQTTPQVRHLPLRAAPDFSRPNNDTGVSDKTLRRGLFLPTDGLTSLSPSPTAEGQEIHDISSVGGPIYEYLDDTVQEVVRVHEQGPPEAPDGLFSVQSSMVPASEPLVNVRGGIWVPPPSSSTKRANESNVLNDVHKGLVQVGIPAESARPDMGTSDDPVMPAAREPSGVPCFDPTHVDPIANFMTNVAEAMTAELFLPTTTNTSRASSDHGGDQSAASLIGHVAYDSHVSHVASVNDRYLAIGGIGTVGASQRASSPASGGHADHPGSEQAPDHAKPAEFCRGLDTREQVLSPGASAMMCMMTAGSKISSPKQDRSRSLSRFLSPISLRHSPAHSLGGPRDAAPDHAGNPVLLQPCSEPAAEEEAQRLHVGGTHVSVNTSCTSPEPMTEEEAQWARMDIHACENAAPEDSIVTHRAVCADDVTAPLLHPRPSRPARASMQGLAARRASDSARAAGGGARASVTARPSAWRCDAALQAALRGVGGGYLDEPPRAGTAAEGQACNKAAAGNVMMERIIQL